MQKFINKRISSATIALFLVCTLVFSCMPAAAYATDTSTETTSATAYAVANKVCRLYHEPSTTASYDEIMPDTVLTVISEDKNWVKVEHGGHFFIAKSELSAKVFYPKKEEYLVVPKGTNLYSRASGQKLATTGKTEVLRFLGDYPAKKLYIARWGADDADGICVYVSYKATRIPLCSTDITVRSRCGVYEDCRNASSKIATLEVGTTFPVTFEWNKFWYSRQTGWWVPASHCDVTYGVEEDWTSTCIRNKTYFRSGNVGRNDLSVAYIANNCWKVYETPGAPVWEHLGNNFVQLSIRGGEFFLEFDDHDVGIPFPEPDDISDYTDNTDYGNYDDEPGPPLG